MLKPTALAAPLLLRLHLLPVTCKIAAVVRRVAILLSHKVASTIDIPVAVRVLHLQLLLQPATSRNAAIVQVVKFMLI